MTSVIRVPTLDFDHHSVRASHHRDEVLGEVASHPIFWTEAHGGYWVVASHALAKRVLRDPEVFSSLKTPEMTGGVTIPTMIGPKLIPAEIDPPFHRTLRKILTPKFHNKAVANIAPQLEDLIVGVIDDAVAKNDFDVVHDIAGYWSGRPVRTATRGSSTAPRRWTSTVPRIRTSHSETARTSASVRVCSGCGSTCCCARSSPKCRTTPSTSTRPSASTTLRPCGVGAACRRTSAARTHMNMVGPEDDSLHDPGDEVYWNESSWFPISIPDRLISGWVMVFHRPNMKLTSLGAWTKTAQSMS